MQASALSSRSSSPLDAAPGWKATTAATVGLAFGPSTVLLFLFGVFVGPLQREFGWPRPAISFAVTIVSLMIMLVSPVQGWLIDRYGARRLALWSAVPFAAGLFGVTQVGRDIRGFYLAYALLPWLAIGLWPVSYLRLVSTWFQRRLGLALGVANGGIGLGAAALPLLATALLQRGDWRTAFVGVAAAGLLISFPLNLIWLRERGIAAPGGVGSPLAEAPGSAFREVVRTRSFLGLMIAFFLLGFVNTGLVTNQIPLLTDAGASPQRAAAVQAAFGVAVLLGRFLTGMALDHLSAPRLMASVCLGGVLACALYASGVTNDLVFVCAVLFGAIFGAEFDVLAYLVKRYFGLKAFGRIYGTVFALFQLGAALGVAVLPMSRLHYASYVPGLTAYGAALAVSALLFLWIGARASTEAAALRPGGPLLSEAPA